MIVDANITCPNLKSANKVVVPKPLPFAKKKFEVIEGVLLAPRVFEDNLGDKTAEAIMASVALTISVDLGQVLARWGKG